jgi:hypothetical protein
MEKAMICKPGLTKETLWDVRESNCKIWSAAIIKYDLKKCIAEKLDYILKCWCSKRRQLINKQLLCGLSFAEWSSEEELQLKYIFNILVFQGSGYNIATILSERTKLKILYNNQHGRISKQDYAWVFPKLLPNIEPSLHLACLHGFHLV